jgi:hemerythrin
VTRIDDDEVERRIAAALAARPVDEDIVNSALQLTSVKVPSMDHEHEEIADALRCLAEERSLEALEATLKCMKAHFEHEEKLFEEYGFGGHINDMFSAKKTHIEDHRRITSKMQRQMYQVPGTQAGVTAEFVEEVLKDFHEHTNRYDVQYSELMSSNGAK